MAIISIPSSIGGISIPGNVINGPLGALFGNKYSVDNLKYPRDLESATRGHVVKFYINEIIPVGYEEGKDYNLSSAGAGIVKSTGNVVSDAMPDTLLGNKVKSFLGNGSSGDGTQKSSLSLEPEKKRLATTISLYMPEAVSFTYTNNWTEDSIVNVAKEAISGLGGKVVGKAVTGAIESGAGKMLLKSQGLAINPNQQVLFEGIQLRDFSLAFTFTPYSKQESDEVKKIIETFKTYSRPRTVSGSGGMLFIPPAIFDMDFLFNGSVNPNINKVAPSVIMSLEVNYTPNGFSTHTDGSPVQIQMNINFKETKLVDRNGQYGVDKGY